eukprot:scaffold2058_cov69-Phaeocystis_antarctica.AAC.12
MACCSTSEPWPRLDFAIKRALWHSHRLALERPQQLSSAQPFSGLSRAAAAPRSRWPWPSAALAARRRPAPRIDPPARSTRRAASSVAGAGLR